MLDDCGLTRPRDEAEKLVVSFGVDFGSPTWKQAEQRYCRVKAQVVSNQAAVRQAALDEEQKPKTNRRGKKNKAKTHEAEHDQGTSSDDSDAREVVVGGVGPRGGNSIQTLASGNFPGAAAMEQSLVETELVSASTSIRAGLGSALSHDTIAN